MNHSTHRRCLRRALCGAAVPLVMLVPAVAIAAGWSVGHAGPNPDTPHSASAPAADGPSQSPPAAILHLPLVWHTAGVSQLPVPPTALPAATLTPTAAATSTAPPPTEPPPPPTDPPTATAVPSPTPKVPWWGAYDEALTDFASLDDLKSGYRQANWYPTLLDLLDRRYRSGRYVVTKLNDSQTNAGLWVGDQTGSFAALVGQVNVTVHEMSHQLSWQEGIMATRLQKEALIVRDDLTLLMTRVETYPRAEIARYVVGPLDNQYKAIYLTGASGDQGFGSVLNELNAYTHSLFVGYGLHDQNPPGRRQSDRDGLVTFMLYTQLYLRHARTDHPSDHARLRAEPEIRDAVRLLWARANFILDVTEDIPGLALDPVAVESEMRKPDMQAEIRDFIAAP